MKDGFKLSISNIAWDSSFDEEMYRFLSGEGIEGLEIAPTRVFPEEPYNHLAQAEEFRKRLFEKYGLEISSMQSIWYGRSERIWADERQRDALTEYSKRAAEFAHALRCRNLVFGCPKNRRLAEGESPEPELEFFGRLGELAVSLDMVFAVEANPEIYGTNYLNTTEQAYELIKRVASDGIRLNYDFGTVLYNREPISDVKRYSDEINHVHISEPELAAIRFSGRHAELTACLRESGYSGYVSLEMKNPGDIDLLRGLIRRLKYEVGRTDEIR